MANKNPTRPVIITPAQAAGILNHFDNLSPVAPAAGILGVLPGLSQQNGGLAAPFGAVGIGNPPNLLDPFVNPGPPSLPQGAASGLLQQPLSDTVNQPPMSFGPSTKACIFDARVRGNNLPITHPNTPGAYGVPETTGSGLLDRGQWAPPELTDIQKNQYMAQFRNQLVGEVPDGKGGYRQVFQGMSDNIGADLRSQGKTIADLENANPNQVLVELAGQGDMDIVPGFRVRGVPVGVPCPTPGPAPVAKSRAR